MKVIKIFILLIFSACFAFSQCKQKSISNYQGQFLVFSSEFEYNNLGQILKQTKIHSPVNKAVFKESVEYTYNEDGKKSKEEYFVDSNKTKQINFQYDLNGNLLKEEEFANSIRTSSTDYKGKIATKQFFDKDGNVYLTEEIISKDSLNYLSKTVKDENQNSVLLFANSYNENGNLIEKKFADLKNNSEQIIKYSFDELGKVQEESMWDNGKLVSKIETNYMPKKIIISNFDRNGNQQSEIERQLNLNGQVISEELRVAGMETNKTIFTYDNFGNKSLSRTLGPNGGELSRVVWKYNCNK